MRIAIVINTSWNIFNFRMGLIKALRNEGHEVIAVAPKDKYATLIREEGFAFHHIAMDNKGANPVKDLLLIERLRRLYKKIKPDVIFHYTIKPNIYGTLAAKTLKIPVVNNVSGLGTVFLHKNRTARVARGLYKLAFRYPYHVFFQNVEDKKLFERIGLVKEQLTGLLPGSGVDLDTFHVAPLPRHDRPHFLLIARLLFDKGVCELIEAIRILKSKNYTFQCDVVGNIDPSANLGVSQAEVDEWVSEGLINYKGVTDDVREHILRADCVVLPSYREGTPRSLLEAGAMGRPLITTNVSGCREVVQHDYNGYLCRAKDAQALADAMERFMLLPEREKEQLGQNSRRYIKENFDQKLVIDQYLNVLNNIQYGSH